jgi:hypothetical protein
MHQHVVNLQRNRMFDWLNAPKCLFSKPVRKLPAMVSIACGHDPCPAACFVQSGYSCTVLQGLHKFLCVLQAETEFYLHPLCECVCVVHPPW